MCINISFNSPVSKIYSCNVVFNWILLVFSFFLRVEFYVWYCKRREWTTTKGFAWGQQLGKIRFILRNKRNTVHSPLSMFFLLISFLLFQSPFPMLSPFLIYFYLHHISTIHFYLTSLLSWHLLPFTSEEDVGKSLLSCALHCSDYFLINAIDKAVVYFLMRMQQATPGQKLPYCPLTSTLFRSYLLLKIPQSTMIHFFSSSGGFLPWACGLQYFYINATTFQLHPRFLSTYIYQSQPTFFFKKNYEI